MVRCTPLWVLEVDVDMLKKLTRRVKQATDLANFLLSVFNLIVPNRDFSLNCP
jgi:hypothetical protein